MSSFKDPPKIRKLKKRHFWHRQMYQFLAPIEYITKAGETIRIETGFILDFASIPWLICLIFGYSARGWYAKAVAFHDQGYRHSDGKPRKWWDDIMKEIMEVLAECLAGLPIPKKMQRTIDRFYRAVDRHGGGAWNKHRKS